ncbi:YchJ family protein [Methylomonas paludis]
MMSTISDTKHCLCGSDLSYADCCQRYHSGAAQAPSAEALMRSRFSAYAMRNVDYLLVSWDVAKRPAEIDFSKETAQWQHLQIINCKKGGIQDSKGIVEFKAFYTQDGDEFFMHEISRFVKNGQRWLYLDGIVKSVSKVGLQNQTGRNAACACGSGLKFKRCCGK